MSMIQRLIDKFRRKPPVIETAWGPVPESARRQAETNLRLDPEKRDRVLAIIAKEIGKPDYERDIDQRYDVVREARRRYPLGGF